MMLLLVGRRQASWSCPCLHILHWCWRGPMKKSWLVEIGLPSGVPIPLRKSWKLLIVRPASGKLLSSSNLGPSNAATVWRPYNPCLFLLFIRPVGFKITTSWSKWGCHRSFYPTVVYTLSSALKPMMHASRSFFHQKRIYHFIFPLSCFQRVLHWPCCTFALCFCCNSFRFPLL